MPSGERGRGLRPPEEGAWSGGRGVGPVAGERWSSEGRGGTIGREGSSLGKEVAGGGGEGVAPGSTW